MVSVTDDGMQQTEVAGDVVLDARARDLPGGETVVNDVRLGQRIMLLTGANMAGKSTLMRSVMAVALLGNVGLPVPCAHATVPEVRSPIDCTLKLHRSIASPLVQPWVGGGAMRRTDASALQWRHGRVAASGKLMHVLATRACSRQ